MDLKIEKVVVGEIETNCYVVKKDNNCFIVDPGAEAKKIKELVGKHRIQFILLTHGHFDHVLALMDMKMIYPEADIYIGRGDKNLLSHLSEQSYFIGQRLRDIKLPLKLVKEGDLIKFDHEIITVIETPGHSLGSVCYKVGKNLFSGDTMFYHSIGRTDLPTSDSKLMERSLQKLADLPADTKVFPGHMQETTIIEEKTLGFLANI